MASEKQTRDSGRDPTMFVPDGPVVDLDVFVGGVLGEQLSLEAGESFKTEIGGEEVIIDVIEVRNVR